MNRGMCIGGPLDATYLERGGTTYRVEDNGKMRTYIYLYRWWVLLEGAVPGVGDILNKLDAAYIERKEQWQSVGNSE